MPPRLVPDADQPALELEIIRQYPGLVQVERAVIVNAPGKHFGGLTAAEQTNTNVTSQTDTAL